MACQLLARGHCVVPAMHTNSLTKPRPHGLPLLKNVSFTFPRSSHLSSPTNPHTRLPLLRFLSHISLSFFPRSIRGTNMVIRNIQMNYIHSWTPTKAIKYYFIQHSLLLVLFLYCNINRGLYFLFSRTRTHTNTLTHTAPSIQLHE